LKRLQHCICAHTPHVPIGQMDSPCALHVHNQGTLFLSHHYHHAGFASVPSTVNDPYAITIFYTLIILSHLKVLLKILASVLLKRVCLCATKYHQTCSQKDPLVCLVPFRSSHTNALHEHPVIIRYVFSTHFLPILACVDPVFNSQLRILADRHIFGTLNRL
jgi:hypothetical protein